MKLTNERYMALAEMYLMDGLGRKVNGLIHNMNNYIHVVDMQMAMLMAKASSSGDQPLSAFESKLSKSAMGMSRIVKALQSNGQCSFYAQKEPAQINIADFLAWLMQFWENDLFFKHKVSSELNLQAEGLNLLLSPFHLTVCLEQGIRNALEAYQEVSSSGENRLMVDVTCPGEGVSIEVSSYTMLPEFDPWEEGSSSKPGHLGMGLPVSLFMARNMGWKIDLHKEGEKTVYSVLMPNSKR